MRHIEAFFITIALFLLLDWLWFMNIASSIYATGYAVLFRSPEELVGGSVLLQYFVPIVIVYVLMTLGIINFAIPSSNKTTTSLACFGGLFGLILYGVYNGILFTFFKEFPLQLALIDTLWGVFSCALITSVVGRLRYRK